jgi:hypothetical protein
MQRDKPNMRKNVLCFRQSNEKTSVLSPPFRKVALKQDLLYCVVKSMAEDFTIVYCAIYIGIGILRLTRYPLFIIAGI